MSEDDRVDSGNFCSRLAPFGARRCNGNRLDQPLPGAMTALREPLGLIVRVPKIAVLVAVDQQAELLVACTPLI
jgi:hypothetical protein